MTPFKPMTLGIFEGDTWQKTADPLAKASMHHWHTEGPATQPRLHGFHKSLSLEG